MSFAAYCNEVNLADENSAPAIAYAIMRNVSKGTIFCKIFSFY